MKKKQSDSSEFTEADYIDFIATPHTEVLVEFPWFRCILKYVIFSVIGVSAIAIFVAVAFWGWQAYKDEANTVPPTAQTPNESGDSQNAQDSTSVLAGSGFDDKSTRRLVGHKKLVNALAFSPNLQWVLSGEGDSHYSSPNGAGGADSTNKSSDLSQSNSESYGLYVWSYDRGRIERKLTEHRKPISAVAFSPDGTMAASADIGGTFILWNTINWNIIDKYESGTRCGRGLERVLCYKCLAFSPDGTILAVGGSVQPTQSESEEKHISQKAAVILWNVQQHSEQLRVDKLLGYRPMFEFSSQCDCVYSLSYTLKDFPIVVGASGADSGIFLLEKDGAISRVLDLQHFRSSMQNIKQYSSGHDSPVCSYIEAAIRFDQRHIVAGDSLGRMTLWNFQTELPGQSRFELLDMVKQPDQFDSHVRDIKYSFDGKYIATCGDSICILDGMSEELELLGYLSPASESTYNTDLPYYGQCVAFTPDGNSIAVGCSDKVIRIWNFEHFTSSLRRSTAMERRSRTRTYSTEMVADPMELEFRPQKKNDK